MAGAEANPVPGPNFGNFDITEWFEEFRKKHERKFTWDFHLKILSEFARLAASDWSDHRIKLLTAGDCEQYFDHGVTEIVAGDH